jgi:hypothetical protein
MDASQFSMNHQSSQFAPFAPFAPNLQQYNPYHANPFLAQPRSHQFIPPPASYQGHYQGNVGQYSHAAYGGCSSNNPASPVASMAYFGQTGGSGSRDGENSPIFGSGTPLSTAPGVEAPGNNEEESESSPDENAQKGKSKNWSEKEDEWLVSAWLNNSNDPIDGISKKSDRFWKQIVDEYNMNAPPKLKKTIVQCKNHWNKTAPKVKRFNAVYNELKSVYASGQSEEQLMKKVRVKYMADTNTKRPFRFEHWWEMVRKQQIWRSELSFEKTNKRNKLSASGEYSSSNKEADGEEESARPPQGQKAAKAQQKGKDKAKAKSGILTNENVQQFNELQLRKSIAAEKMAAAALLQAETEKEKTKAEKLDKYLNLIDKDTSGYSDSQKLRHEQVVEYLAKELGLN